VSCCLALVFGALVYEGDHSHQWRVCVREREDSARRHLSLVTTLEVSLIVALFQRSLLRLLDGYLAGYFVGSRVASRDEVGRRVGAGPPMAGVSASNATDQERRGCPQSCKRFRLFQDHRILGIVGESMDYGPVQLCGRRSLITQDYENRPTRSPSLRRHSPRASRSLRFRRPHSHRPALGTRFLAPPVPDSRGGRINCTYPAELRVCVAVFGGEHGVKLVAEC